MKPIDHKKDTDTQKEEVKEKVLTKKELEVIEAEKIAKEERKKLDLKLDELAKQLDKPITKMEQLKVAHIKNGLEFAQPKVEEKPLFSDTEIEHALQSIDIDAILEKHGLKENGQVVNEDFENMIKQMVSLFLTKIDYSDPASIDAQIEELKEGMLAELGRVEN